MVNGQVLSLTLEQIEQTAALFKEDLQREANRAVRRHDSNAALAALEGIEYVSKFVFTLKMRAGSQIGYPARAKPIRIIRKK
jgi:hypothetical protein